MVLSSLDKVGVFLRGAAAPGCLAAAAGVPLLGQAGSGGEWQFNAPAPLRTLGLAPQPGNRAAAESGLCPPGPSARGVCPSFCRSLGRGGSRQAAEACTCVCVCVRECICECARTRVCVLRRSCCLRCTLGVWGCRLCCPQPGAVRGAVRVHTGMTLTAGSARPRQGGVPQPQPSLRPQQGPRGEGQGQLPPSHSRLACPVPQPGAGWVPCSAGTHCAWRLCPQPWVQPEPRQPAGTAAQGQWATLFQKLSAVMGKDADGSPVGASSLGQGWPCSQGLRDSLLLLPGVSGAVSPPKEGPCPAVMGVRVCRGSCWLGHVALWERGDDQGTGAAGSALWHRQCPGFGAAARLAVGATGPR